MKNLIWLITCFVVSCVVLRAQNVSLDFDGNDDFIITPTVLQNGDFTIETWFLSSDNSTNQNCLQGIKRLVSMGGATTFELGICGGDLNFYFISNTTNTNFVQLDPSYNYNDNQWHHIAISRSGNSLEIFLDCVSVYSNPATGAFNFTAPVRIGNWPGGAAAIAWWKGQVDDFRIWNYGKSLQQVIDEKSCVLAGDEPNLELYYTFDEGFPNAPNPLTTVIQDQSINGNDGNPLNFAFTGTQSNFTLSQTPMAYPDLNNLVLEIKDYPYQNNIITEICNLDPAHFSLLKAGVVPGPFSNVQVNWWYQDGPSFPPVPLASPPFTDFRFGVPQGIIDYDCSLSSTGYVDRTFFAISNVTEPTTGTICEYVSDESDLRICCPISPATVDIVPNDPLCEGETANVQVTLNTPDLFVQTPGPFVNIDWYYDGVLQPSLNNQITFPFTVVAPLVTAPTQLCFRAVVTNCNGKVGDFESCLTVDPEPVCGTIAGWPLAAPMNITLVSSTPHLTYEICPGNDSSVGIATPFQDCIPTWQYSFDCATWIDLGISNSVQQTNILPTSAWGANTSIFYRIQCNPLSNPSGCDPCFSDKIEIRLQGIPANPVVSVPAQVCKGDPITLTLNNPDPILSYTWLCNGLPIGISITQTLIAEKSACYWVEATDGCYALESNRACVEVCEVVAVLSCPLPPNDCACLGDPIDLTACGSYSTCAGANLQYEWFIDNVSQGAASSNCDLNHLPATTGTTYKVVVTNLTTGCMSMTERTIIPCDKGN